MSSPKFNVDKNIAKIHLNHRTIIISLFEFKLGMDPACDHGYSSLMGYDDIVKLRPLGMRHGGGLVSERSVESSASVYGQFSL